jgi:hypothetical protein
MFTLTLYLEIYIYIYIYIENITISLKKMYKLAVWKLKLLLYTDFLFYT